MNQGIGCKFKINNNEYIVKFDNIQICCGQFNTDDVNSFKLDYNQIDRDNSQFILDFEIAKIVFFQLSKICHFIITPLRYIKMVKKYLCQVYKQVI
jgi:hypothetical protein